MDKVLSMHQPNFIPWLGYFHKIAASDVFIVMDNVQYPRGKSVANRNKLKVKDGLLELVVPVSKSQGKDGKVNYLDAKLGNPGWYVKVLKTVKHSYSKAKYFDFAFPELERIFKNPSFIDMNLEFIEWACQILEIPTKRVQMSSLIESYEAPNELIVKLCRSQEANVYLSGSGAKAYNDEDFLNSKGIELRYQQFEHPEYPQIHGDFVPNLSIVDLFFNCGVEESHKVFWSSV